MAHSVMAEEIKIAYLLDESWVTLPQKNNHMNNIEAISSKGRCRRLNGEIFIPKLKRTVTWNGKLTPISHVIADCFLITVRRPEQTLVDHITHNPDGYEVHDVRNLRYCTSKENANFQERRENMSKSIKKSWNDPKTRKLHAEVMTEVWDRPGYKERVGRSISVAKTGTHYNLREK